MATSRIKGITVEIDGDTTGLSKALSSVNLGNTLLDEVIVDAQQRQNLRSGGR